MHSSISQCLRSAMLLMAILMLGNSVQAQKEPQEAIFRDFVRLAKTHKGDNIYLRLRVEMGTNLPLQPGDTTGTEGEYVVRGGRGYAKWGRLEQLFTDSLALMVSPDHQQMVLFGKGHPALAAIRGSLLPGIADSTVDELEKKFRVVRFAAGRDSGGLRLDSRNELRFGGLPMETVTLTYGLRSGLPGEILFIRRGLVPLDSAQLASVKENPVLQGYLLTEEGKTYLLRETTVRTRFLAFERETKRPLPATIADRIVYKGGRYQPAPQFAAYELETGLAP